MLCKNKGKHICCTEEGCSNTVEYMSLPVAYTSGTKMEKVPLCHWCYEKRLTRYFRSIRDDSSAFKFPTQNGRVVRKGTAPN